MSALVRCTVMVSLAAALALPSAAGAAPVVVLGEGNTPGLAVAADGTGYVAWNGNDAEVRSLRFCRLARGATACAGGVKTIATRGTSETRPFIVASGQRVVVVQQRYGGDIAGFNALLAHTSSDGGETFGAPQVIGSLTPYEAVAGPNDTISVVTNSGGWFQNAPIDGSATVNSDGSSSTGAAQLFADDYHLNGAVALIDGTTPIAVFTGNGGDALRYRRYSGSGSLNQQASWLGPVQLSTSVHNFKLVHGPSGLCLIVFQSDGRITSRKWIGTEFDNPVLIVSGQRESPSLHAYEDAGGRLHVTYLSNLTTPGIVHAVSDDGATWRSGTVHTFASFEDGEFWEPRIAAAPDHIGLVAWDKGPGGGHGVRDIRVAAIGPDAPLDPIPSPPPSPTPSPAPSATPTPTPAPKPLGRLSGTGSARRKGRHILVTLKLRLKLPSGVSKANGCAGTVSATVFKGVKTLGTRTGTIHRNCKLTLKGTLKRSAVGATKMLKVTVRFGGHGFLAPSVQDKGTLKLR